MLLSPRRLDFGCSDFCKALFLVILNCVKPKQRGYLLNHFVFARQAFCSCTGLEFRTLIVCRGASSRLTLYCTIETTVRAVLTVCKFSFTQRPPIKAFATNRAYRIFVFAHINHLSERFKKLYVFTHPCGFSLDALNLSGSKPRCSVFFKLHFFK